MSDKTNLGFNLTITGEVQVKDVEKLNGNLQQTATAAPKTSRAIDKVSASTRQLAKDVAAAQLDRCWP